MKTGLQLGMDRIKQKKKDQEMLDEINEMMMKMSFQKQVEDASKKR